MSDSTKRDLRKVKTACLLALLLLPGIIIALPAVSIFHVSASTGSTPTVVVGATAVIDDPVYANIGSGNTVTRTIAVTNPIGNPGITTITISVPSGATTVSPTGTIPANGGVPDCVGVCTASTFGSGPYSIQYTDTLHAGTVILPAGATILITLATKPSTSTAVTSAADVFAFAISVTDTVPQTTQLNSITVFYTTTSQLVNTGPTITSIQAGSTFTFTSATGTNGQSGIPLYASICNHALNATCPATATKVSISPSSFTSGSTAQTVTLNATVATQTVAVTVGAPVLSSSGDSSNGLLVNSTSSNVLINAGPSTALSITVTGQSNKHQVNMTTTTLIGGGSISVSSTDKYGNTVNQVTGLLVTLTATTSVGRAAGFTALTTTGYGIGTSATTYPYTPTDLTVTTQFYISAGQNTNTSNKNFYFGPDYGSMSTITASASGVSSQTSGNVVTWGFNSGNPTMFPLNALTINAGATQTVTAQVGGLAAAQGGVTVYFNIASNSTNSAGTYAGSRTAVATTSVNSSGYAVASVSFTAATKSGVTVTLGGKYVVSPTANSTSGATGVLTTQAGVLSKITLQTYFLSTEGSSKTSVVATSGTLYIDACLTDAYGNSLAVSSGIVQVTLTTSSGSLSSGTAFVTGPNSCITASGYQVSYVAPSSVGTVVTLGAGATYNGATASGSFTLTVVTSSPSVSFTSVPTAVTTGFPQTVTGWANASTGISANTITTLQYSLNGAANVSLAAGASTNSFSITVIFPSAHNYITVYATDAYSHTTALSAQVPVLPPAQTFVPPSGANNVPHQYQFPSGPVAINATFTNNGISALTVIVVANVLNAQGAVILESTGTVTAAVGATVSAFPVIQGIPHGTYTVQVTVYSTAYVTLSSTYSVTVTV